MVLKWKLIVVGVSTKFIYIVLWCALIFEFVIPAAVPAVGNNNKIPGSAVLPAQPQNERPRWVQGLEPCSATCGGGLQRMVPECWQGGRRINDRDCSPNSRPEADFLPCAQTPCNVVGSVPRWIMGEWGSCSSKCGPGWKRKIPRCVVDGGPYILKEVEESKCPSQARPLDEMGQCSSGVSVPCPPFASPDVVCFSPPCRTTAGDSSDSGADPGPGFGFGDPDEGDPAHRPVPPHPACLAALVLVVWLYCTLRHR